MTGHRSVGWLKDDAMGVEWADLRLEPDRFDATVVAVGAVPLPYRLDATLETGPGWVTRRLHVTTRGTGWSRALDLRRDDDGRWSVEATADGEATGDGETTGLAPPGGDADPLTDALDCDLGLSPLTNSMPVLRDGLLTVDGERMYRMAWVEVPSLRVFASPQGYATEGHDPDGLRRIRYRSLDGDFTSLLTFDADGLVVDYPGLARRLGRAGQPAGR